MRITQGMINTSMMSNLQNNYKRMDKYQEQITKSSVLNRPSDNPVAVASALYYRSEISSTDQFSENVQDATSWLEYNDTVMSEATEIIQRLSELAVQGGTDTVPADARKSIAEEVAQLYDHLVSLGNSQFKGKYIFNGERTTEKPYPSDPANDTYQLDQGEVNYQIGAGIYMTLNTIGDKVFGASGDNTGLFAVVKGLENALNNDNTADIQQSISSLQQNLESIVKVQAEIGGRQNRLDFTVSRLEGLSLNYTTLQSKTEDVDMPKAITELTTAESIYQASLDTMSRIIQPSLLDFLR